MLVVWVSTGKSQSQPPLNSSIVAEPALDSTSLLSYSVIKVRTDMLIVVDQAITIL